MQTEEHNTQNVSRKCEFKNKTSKCFDEQDKSHKSKFGFLWFKTNKLSLNIEKTTSHCFRTKKKSSQMQLK